MWRLRYLVFWLVLGGCRSSPQDTPESPQERSEWTIGPTQFSVGGATNDERYTLSQVVGATRLGDGGIVVADHYAQGLRSYDSNGEYLATVGGEGQGPGEYRFIRGLGRCEEDRIVAFDLAWDQKVYLEDLTLVDERPPEVPGLNGSAYEFACAPTGYAVATGWGDTQSQFKPGFFVATAPVVLVRGGQLVHDFGERLSSERVGTLGGSGPHPFGRKTSVAISNQFVFLGDGSAYSVEVYNLEGDRVGTVSWQGRPRAIEDRHYDLYAAERLRSVDPVLEPSIRRELSDLPLLEQFPAYDRLLVGRAGDLWVRTFPEPGADQIEWSVVSPEGSFNGTVRVPATWEVLEIGGDYLLIVETDPAVGLQTVRMASLSR